jgi:hypothetical protein
MAAFSLRTACSFCRGVRLEKKQRLAEALKLFIPALEVFKMRYEQIAALEASRKRRADESIP